MPETVYSIDIERLIREGEAAAARYNKSRDEILPMSRGLWAAKQKYRSKPVFGEWLVSSAYQNVGDTDRAALINIGKHLEQDESAVIRVLRTTKLFSPQSVWKEIKGSGGSRGKSGGKSGGKGSGVTPRRDDHSDLAHIRVWCLEQFKAGKAVSEHTAAEAFGLEKGDKAAQLGFYEARGAWFERIDPEIDPESLPKTLHKKFESAIKQAAARMESTNRTWRIAEAQSIMKRLKAEAFPDWEKDAQEARTNRVYYEKLLNNHKSPLTYDEYMLLHLCIRGDASDEKRHQAGVLLNTKRLILVGKPE